MEGHSNLYVYGLPPGCDDAALRALFGSIGTVTSVKAVTDRRYGFVRFSSTLEAQTAINTMNGHVLNGSRITVLMANRDTGQNRPDAAAMALQQSLAGSADAGCDIFVRGLPPNLSNDQVKSVFEQYGVVISVQAVTTDTSDGQSQTTALVKMSDFQIGVWLVTNLNGNIPQGLERPLEVSLASAPALVQQKPIDLSANRYSPYGGGKAGGAAGGALAGLSDAALNAQIAAAAAAGGGGAIPKGFKTRLCTQFTERGMCPRGDQCTFAHGGQEVKGFRTKLCKYSAGLCPSGDKCSFAHSGTEVKGFKSRMCKFDAGQCPQGISCSFAHSALELQQGQELSAASAAAGANGYSEAVAAAAMAQAAAATAMPAPALQAVGAEALDGLTWGSLNAQDLVQLASLGLDLNTLLALSQVGGGAEGAVAQPAMEQVAALSAASAQTPQRPGGGFKTRLCTYFTDTGVCPNGPACTFAHGAQEIHGFKTRMCKFAETGGCPQGSKCSFAHSPTELHRITP